MASAPRPRSRRSRDAAARFLIERGAKIIVVACNTASVSALHTLRATFATPDLSAWSPPSSPPPSAPASGVFGVAATEASARGDYLKGLIRDHANGVRVLAVGCPRLVTMVEAGIIDGPEAEAAIRAYIAPMLDAGIDELVLGCTHFPAMRAAFERVAGPHVEVIDSGAAIARQTRRVLAGQGLLAVPEGDPAARTRPRRARRLPRDGRSGTLWSRGRRHSRPPGRGPASARHGARAGRRLDAHTSGQRGSTRQCSVTMIAWSICTASSR